MYVFIFAFFFFFVFIINLISMCGKGKGTRLRTPGGMRSQTEISASFDPGIFIGTRLRVSSSLVRLCGCRSGIKLKETHLKKSPTFSAQCARHSEQHGPDKHQTSRRLHLVEPTVFSPYSKLRSVLYPLPPKKKRIRFFHTSELSSFFFVFFFVVLIFIGTFGVVVRFPISVTSSLEFRACW